MQNVQNLLARHRRAKTDKARTRAEELLAHELHASPKVVARIWRRVVNGFVEQEWPEGYQSPDDLVSMLLYEVMLARSKTGRYRLPAYTTERAFVKRATTILRRRFKKQILRVRRNQFQPSAKSPPGSTPTVHATSNSPPGGTPTARATSPQDAHAQSVERLFGDPFVALLQSGTTGARDNLIYCFLALGKRPVKRQRGSCNLPSGQQVLNKERLTYLRDNHWRKLAMSATNDVDRTQKIVDLVYPKKVGTSKELAHILGVSPATITRVKNDAVVQQHLQTCIDKAYDDAKRLADREADNAIVP